MSIHYLLFVKRIDSEEMNAVVYQYRPVQG
jgi:hypothetical protein